MQDAQNDRSQKFIDYANKGPNVIANISRKSLLFSIHCLYDIYVLKKQKKKKRLIKLKIPFSFQTLDVNNYMRGSNGETAGPDPRTSILNFATLSEPPWSATRQPFPS